MENSRKICILEQFRPYLRLLEAYNPKHFHHPDWLHFLHSVSYALCATAMVVHLPLVASLAIWYLIEVPVDLKMFVVQVPIQCCALQILIALLALLAKASNITETINRIQDLINQREECACEIYKDAERKHAFWANWLTKVSIGLIVVVSLLPALPPISHSIFGYPLPQYWSLPLETQ